MVSSPRAEKKKKARLTLRSGEKDIADLARKSNEQAATEERLWDRLEGKRRRRAHLICDIDVRTLMHTHNNVSWLTAEN